jgi:hypothetical protein
MTQLVGSIEGVFFVEDLDSAITSRTGPIAGTAGRRTQHTDTIAML